MSAPQFFPQLRGSSGLEVMGSTLLGDMFVMPVSLSSVETRSQESSPNKFQSIDRFYVISLLLNNTCLCISTMITKEVEGDQ